MESFIVSAQCQQVAEFEARSGLIYDSFGSLVESKTAVDGT